jgi:phospholipid/cholesterol/gamma-HCH transport system substrate-binding protein
MQGAWKVGLLVVVFGVLLVGAYQILGRKMFAPKTTTLYAELEDVTGVNVGAPVLMSGVKIGAVSKVELTHPKLARLTMEIDETARIPMDSSVQVPTPLLGFGDNPVHVIPGTLTGGTIAEGTVLRGTRLSAFEGILPDLDTTVEELNKTLVAMQDFVGDGTLKNNINRLTDSAVKTIDRFGALAGNVEGLVADNRGAIAQSMKSVQLAMLDVQRSATLARGLLEDPRWKDEASALLTSMNATVQKANEVLGSVDALINDPNIRQPIHESLANAKTITESGTRIAASAEKITEEGIVISKNITSLTQKANELADETRTVLKKIQDFFNRVPSTGGLRGVEAGMDLIRETEPAHWRTDVSAKIPIGGGSNLHMGVFDAFESNKLTLQLGKPYMSTNEYRYGIYASKPGVGVDLQLARNLKFKGDLYDINDPRLDIGVRYEFKNGLLGWLGFNRLFDRNSVYAGLGFRK